jgi:hypothetical protein
VSEAYEGKQIVGIDLHRRRSVVVRMTEAGQRLETVRISNDPEYLRQVMARAGEAPEVVLEATYGWYWAADTLAELGATVHLAHPLGVKGFSYRRVKNDERDAADLAGTVASTEGELGQAVLMHRRRSGLPVPRSSFAGFRFPPEVITVAVRWYLRYGLSYRDVEELLADRGHRGRSRHEFIAGCSGSLRC